MLSRDLEGDGGGEVVILLTGSLQQREPYDDPDPVLRPPELALETGVFDHGALAGCEVEGEALVLEPASTAGLKTAGLEKDLLQSVEWEFLESDVREGRVERLVGGTGVLNLHCLCEGVGVAGAARTGTTPPDLYILLLSSWIFMLTSLRFLLTSFMALACNSDFLPALLLPAKASRAWSSDILKAETRL